MIPFLKLGFIGKLGIGEMLNLSACRLDADNTVSRIFEQKLIDRVGFCKITFWVFHVNPNLFPFLSFVEIKFTQSLKTHKKRKFQKTDFISWVSNQATGVTEWMREGER